MEDSPIRDRDTEIEKSSKHHRKSKEHRTKERARDHEKDRGVSSRDNKRKEERDEKKEHHDRDSNKHGRERERERDKDYRKDREREKDRGNGRETEIEKERVKERGRDNDKEKQHRERDRGGKEKPKEERSSDKDRDRERASNRERDESEEGAIEEDASGGVPTSELGNRISKMREQRLSKKSEDSSDVLAWVNRLNKIEKKKNTEKERALQLSKVFEEQDNLVHDESEDEAEADWHAAHDLAGVKVLNGLDKVMEGGAVVLTLKDQNILADGDINNEIDMLENVELGEQKRRNEAYKAAKKKAGTYVDKFNDDPGSEKKMLPQYDEPEDEGLILDAKGRFTGEAEKKLEELRLRIHGQGNNSFQDISSSTKISSDYFTHDEMLQFKKPKPKKKKSLRKKDKLDIDAMEAEAVAAGLGAGDLGTRNDARRQAIKDEQERVEAEKRTNAYLSAYAKADEASKLLKEEQSRPVKRGEDDSSVFADDDDDDLYKSLRRARELALKKQEETTSGPQAIARLAASTHTEVVEDESLNAEESQETKVVFTEMEEFVSGLQFDEDVHKPKSDDVFMDEDEVPRAPDQEIEVNDGGWAEVMETGEIGNAAKEEDEELVPDETIHEVAVGKGLSGALKLLKERGTLKETVEWGGRNMDKKKSKLVGIVDNDGVDNRFKDIRIERTDEFGRTMTPKESFRILSHKFHGKGPGKVKQEKRMKQYQEEMKLKQMKNSDTPSHSVERMREAQARMKTPYLVLSGHVKPGQTSDPQSGFATVERDVPGSLTPMLGDKKVDYFLGIKRKAQPGNSNAPKKPKT